MRLIFVMLLARQRHQLMNARSSRRTDSLGCNCESLEWTASPRYAWRAAEPPRARTLGRVAGETVDRGWEHTSADSAAIWAREALATKNRLAAADAKLVEDAFAHKLSELAPSATMGAADDAAPTTRVERVGIHEMRAKGNNELDHAEGIDKSVLVIATPRRYRNREHLRYVARQACLICGRKQSDPHHLRYLQPRALGRKASDEFVVPLCRSHHRAVHRAGDGGSGGRRPASTPSRSPVSCGDKPGSMIRKSITRRVSRRTRRLDQLPRPLTVRGIRGPIRSS